MIKPLQICDNHEIMLKSIIKKNIFIFRLRFDSERYICINSIYNESLSKKVISRSSAIIRSIFPARSKKQEYISGSKTNDQVCKSILVQLKDNKAYGRDVKMVHRRLAQYQRLRWHGSNVNQAEALKKLEKEWRRYERNRLRKIKGENGTIIPIQCGSGE